MAHDDAALSLVVSVAYSPRAGEVDVVQVTLESGATVLDALNQSRMLQRHPEIDLAVQRVAIWGKFCEPRDALRELDRVEICRPLQVDPKEARRLRYRKHLDRFKS